MFYSIFDKPFLEILEQKVGKKDEILPGV